MTDVQLVATCPEELVETLAAEIEELGGTDIRPAYRSVHFRAGMDVFYAMHRQLRTASRLLRVVRETAAGSSQMLFDQASRLPWPDFFDTTRTFAIDAIAADGKDGSWSQAEIMRRVREGVMQSFTRRRLKPPSVDTDAPRVTIVAFVQRGRCTFALDSSGKSMDKRGYRQEGHPAPLKETLAAGILRLIGYDGSCPLYDPMCGSGTLVIEGAQIGLGKPPLIHRAKGEFGIEWMLDFDRGLWRTTEDRLRAMRRPAPPSPIFASDIDGSYVELARRNALRARVERDITFSVGRFQDQEAPAPSGILVANLPYGTRIGGSDQDLKPFYMEIGDTLKHRFQGWTAALLVARDSPHKFIGLKPGRRIPLMNGRIPAWLLTYEIRPWKQITPASDDTQGT
jgi:putative N6-adenine-specific DNA methylase